MKKMTLTMLVAGLTAPAISDEQQLKGMTTDYASSWLSENLTERAAEVFDYASALITLGGKPEYDLTVLKAYDQDGAASQFWFSQLNANRTSDYTTVNLGLGFRRFSENKHWLVGANAFYDHEFPYDHQRWGAGLELKSSVVSFTSNQYWGLSDEKSDKNSVKMKVRDGADYGLAIAIPYLPSSRIGYDYFRWDGLGSNQDTKGNKSYLSAQLTPWLGIEAGRKDFRSALEQDDNYVSLTFSHALGATDQPVGLSVSESPYQLRSVDYLRHKPVRRHNKLVKSTTSFSGRAVGL